ncbi:hypothetical protein JHW43_003585 [Diplocarpon mali]|nr:hypothetical protein JHW43_003585 [Diplocarpon mali]
MFGNDRVYFCLLAYPAAGRPGRLRAAEARVAVRHSLPGPRERGTEVVVGIGVGAVQRLRDAAGLRAALDERLGAVVGVDALGDV